MSRINLTNRLVTQCTLTRTARLYNCNNNNLVYNTISQYSIHHNNVSINQSHIYTCNRQYHTTYITQRQAATQEQDNDDNDSDNDNDNDPTTLPTDSILNRLQYVRRQQLHKLISLLPKGNDNKMRKLNHKNGYGLRFTRCVWDKYSEPSYYTVARYKPYQDGHHCKIWGIRTFRGVSDNKIIQIPSTHKHEWRLVVEPELQYPPHIANDKTVAQQLIEFDASDIDDNEIIKSIDVHNLREKKQEFIQKYLAKHQ